MFVRHYNDQRGVDIYRNVRYAVIISRSEKPEWVLEDLAETFYYDDPNVIAITRMADWRARFAGTPFARHRGRRRVEMADGSFREFECETHPDPHVEAIRRLLVNAEVLQAVMRVRPYDRTDANPVDIFLFSDVDVGLPVHSLVRWVDFSDTETEMMAAECDVVFAKAATAMRAFPDVFGNLKERRVRQMLAAQIGGASFLRDWQQVEFRIAERTADGRASYAERAFIAPTRSEPGELIAIRLGCAIEWRGGQGANWRRAEPQTAGIQDGVQSLADKVEDLSTQDVPKLNERLAEAKRPTIPNQNTAA